MRLICISVYTVSLSKLMKQTDFKRWRELVFLPVSIAQIFKLLSWKEKKKKQICRNVPQTIKRWKANKRLKEHSVT